MQKEIYHSTKNAILVKNNIAILKIEKNIEDNSITLYNDEIVTCYEMTLEELKINHPKINTDKIEE